MSITTSIYMLASSVLLEATPPGIKHNISELKQFNGARFIKRGRIPDQCFLRHVLSSRGKCGGTTDRTIDPGVEAFLRRRKIRRDLLERGEHGPIEFAIDGHARIGKFEN